MALFLGILQGLTEFLPVSSSGHLLVMQNLFGLGDMEQYILFDLALHMGTLLAVLIIFRSSIVRILRSQWIYILYLAVGVAVFIPFAPCIHFLKGFYERPQYLGLFFIITAAVLFAGERVRLVKRDGSMSLLKKLVHVAVIGVSQVITILPGVSRSGTTISVARMLGWRADDAAEFSFLLAIPMILAGTGYELIPYIKGEMSFTAVPVSSYIIGFIASCLVGCVALKWLMGMLNKGKFGYFSLYCLVLGVVTLVCFNF